MPISFYSIVKISGLSIGEASRVLDKAAELYHARNLKVTDYVQNMNAIRYEGSRGDDAIVIWLYL